MASNTYKLMWSADVQGIQESDIWERVESKLYSTAANRVAYDFQIALEPIPNKRELQLQMCLKGGPLSHLKCRPQARIVKESIDANGALPSNVVFRPQEITHSVTFVKDEWVAFQYRYHLSNRQGEEGNLITSRMELLSRMSRDSKIILHIFIEIPTHNFDISNLLDDPEMPSLVPQDIVSNPRDSEADRTASKLYNSIFTDPVSSFTDYKLVSVDKDVFPCHRCVLATASEPLRVMLNSEMVEGTGDSFLIRNASSATVKHFRAFIYKGALEDSESISVQSLVELIELAQMYELPRLKGLCEQEYIRLGPPVSNPVVNMQIPGAGTEIIHPNTYKYRLDICSKFELEGLRFAVQKWLITEMTPENAVEYLELAKIFSLRLLYTVAIRYLYDNWESMNTEARDWLRRNADDLMEILDVKAKTQGVTLTSTAYSNPKNLQAIV